MMNTAKRTKAAMYRVSPFVAKIVIASILFAPFAAVPAYAANNTFNGGSYTGFYGNDGTATAPTADTSTSSNTLIIGQSGSGPTISDVGL
jgi:hypothetical protein